MKIIHSIILLLCFSPLCQAQNDWEDTPDTMAIISRAKADAVLKHFDTIQAPKLLYSLDDTYYYLIIKNSPSHKEYYIVLDSLGLIEKLYYIKDEAKTTKITKKIMLNQTFVDKAFSASAPKILVTINPNNTYMIIMDKP